MLQRKKYAFLTDYLRLKIIQEYGGIYFDTDVEVIRSFDDLLDAGAFLVLKHQSMLIQEKDLVRKQIIR